MTRHDIVAVELDEHAILGELLLDEDDLFCAARDKIAARIEWALVHLGQLHLALLVQIALVALQHDRYAADGLNTTKQCSKQDITKKCSNKIK